jgi:PPOX class probable F420-dependent enzyme
MLSLVATSRVRDFDDAVPSARYLLLTTYRRDGRPVATPVWFAHHESRIVVWTDARSGKVRRIRATSRVTLRTCTMRGKPTSTAVEATATILPPCDVEASRDALSRRYAFVIRLYRLATRRRTPHAHEVYVALDRAPSLCSG